MRSLLIDDLRAIDADVVARTFDDGIEALKKQRFDVLYLDHDLGDPDPKKTGYGIMVFLEENLKLLPGKIICVSSNYPGRKRIEAVIEKLYENN